MLIFGLLSIYLLSALPTQLIFEWLYIKSSKIKMQLETQKSPIYFSKMGLLQGLSYLLDFAKGFGLMWVSVLLLPEAENWLILSAILILLGQYFSLFRKGKQAGSGLMVLWGLYTFISPILFLIMPLSFVLFSLLLNTFLFGQFGCMLTALGMLWFLEFPPQYLMINFVIFLITFLAQAKQVFTHVETGEYTIEKQFMRR